MTWLRRFIDRSPKVVKRMEEGFEDPMAMNSLAARYSKRFGASQGVQRLNEEIRRRKRVIGIFADEKSVKRCP